MTSRYISMCRIFLMLGLMCAVSIGTADAGSTGRLIVSADPNLGRTSVVTLRIDGRTAANIRRGNQFNRSVSTGRRVLAVSNATAGSRFSSTVVDVRRGRTYTFTVRRRGSNNVVLVPQGQF